VRIHSMELKGVYVLLGRVCVLPRIHSMELKGEFIRGVFVVSGRTRRRSGYVVRRSSTRGYTLAWDLVDFDPT
jgi:hypothetical protein